MLPSTFYSSTGEQLIATILKHDTKTTSYKLALLRGLNDIVLTHPELNASAGPVAVPLSRLAAHWIGYYWPFTNPAAPIYQGARSVRQNVPGNDLSFRPALTHLQAVWEAEQRSTFAPADGFFLVSEMQTPRRRAMYSPTLQQAYDQALAQILPALAMPIKHAGPGHWSVFPKPARLEQLAVTPALGAGPRDPCVVVSADLWQAFHRLSLYVEALCLHEWSLFTEQVRQLVPCSRGAAYTLLTARPENRRPLSWERNQVDVLLLENHAFICPWTQQQIVRPAEYDLDHLLPVSLYPINELWNLLPVNKEFNQRVKRDRVPSAERLTEAQPWLAQAYVQYQQSTALTSALREDATRRFAELPASSSFAPELARRAGQFINELANSRLISRF